MPVLVIDETVIVAIVVQQLELSGQRPSLTAESRDAATHAAGLLLGALRSALPISP